MSVQPLRSITEPIRWTEPREFCLAESDGTPATQTFIGGDITASFTGTTDELLYRYHYGNCHWSEYQTVVIGYDWTDLGYRSYQVRRSFESPNSVETRFARTPL